MFRKLMELMSCNITEHPFAEYAVFGIPQGGTLSSPLSPIYVAFSFMGCIIPLAYMYI